MNVVHVLPFGGLGGGPRYVVETSRELASRGHQVRVHFPLTDVQRPLARALRADGVVVERLALARSGAPRPRDVRAPLGPLDDDTLVLLHCGDLAELGALRALVDRARTVVVLHTLAPPAPPLLLSRLKRGAQRVATAVVVHRAAAVSHAAAASWGPHLPTRVVIEVASGGVRLPVPRARPLVSRRVKAVTCGTLDIPVKGLDVVIDALPALPALELHLLGDGPHKEALHRRAMRAGVADRVAFAGAVDDVAAELAASDLFLFPSREEAFGLALVEAMAAGLPCVASDLPGIREAGGDEVRYFAPGDPAALVDAVAALLASRPEARALGLRAAARASTWTWARTVDALLAAGGA